MTEIHSHSSAFLGCTYDPERQLLWIRFRTGDLYLYQGVPAAIVQELLQARSQGQYFNSAIRGHFSFRILS